jgi:hypothetical protein
MSETLRLWSVTTLLKLGLGTSDALVNWNVRTTAETAFDKIKTLQAFVEDGERDGAVKWLMDSRWKRSGRAAARGTDVHKAAELLALGKAPEVEDHILPFVEQYTRCLDEHSPEFLMSEAVVYAPRFGYAGTCDGVMRLDGQVVVFDIKTTEHAPDSGRSRPPYAEVALQLCAYRRAELVGVLSEQRYAAGKRYYVFDPSAQHELMPATQGAVCIVVSPYDYMVVPVRTDEAVWTAWRHVMEAARWQVETSRNVFGPPISARQQVAA